MYLLDEAQGRGIGGRLMDEFLTRAGSAPIRLWVTDYNERAIRFCHATDSAPQASESSGERGCRTCS
ncbi:GNAT family N-acetyltransferase [Streptomyces sp. NPDC048603]|uniref:GNAT family N-acetyltransferase n=1 Tax=Streptomyces sp. NPDC048603 TaxID=3365577 RepID=UPI0037194665